VQELESLYGVRDVSDETRIVGIVGHPLGHSLSPVLHNTAYRHLGLDFIYVPLDAERLEPALGAARELGLRGFSVTLPYKVEMVSHLDGVDPLARAVGAVNTVVCDGEARIGFNTDATGGVAPLRERMALAGMPVAVLGAGGAARALVHGLAEEGASVTVFNRTPERAGELARGAGVDHRPLADLERHPYRVLVNATSVGMAPEPETMPVPAEWLRGDLIYDIVYNPAETRLLREARSRGIATLGGLEMFVQQAAEQFRLFTGRDAPLEVMRDAARDHLEASFAAGEREADD